MSDQEISQCMSYHQGKACAGCSNMKCPYSSEHESDE